MDSILKYYETKLKKLNPQLESITYDISDLQSFMKIQNVTFNISEAQLYFGHIKTFNANKKQPSAT